MVKNLPSKAGGTGSVPSWGTKIPYTSGQVNLNGATTEPMPSGVHMLQLESIVKVKVAQLCPTFVIPWTVQDWITFVIPGLYRNSPGQNTGVGSLSVLQGIFPTQGSSPGLPHCRQILYQPSTQGKPNKRVHALQQKIFYAATKTRCSKKKKKNKTPTTIELCYGLLCCLVYDPLSTPATVS